jgi:hypothetical protein
VLVRSSHFRYMITWATCAFMWAADVVTFASKAEAADELAG